jgi:hypothetical protein
MLLQYNINNITMPYMGLFITPEFNGMAQVTVPKKNNRCSIAAYENVVNFFILWTNSGSIRCCGPNPAARGTFDPRGAIHTFKYGGASQCLLYPEPSGF